MAITEVVEIPCMPVRPLHLVRAIAPMRCSPGRRHGGLLLGCLRLLSLTAMEGFYWDACGCSLGRRHGGLLLGQLRRLGGEERLCAWRRHAGAASSEGRLLGLEPRPAAAVFQLGLALRGKLRRASSGLGGTARPLSG